MLRSGAGSAAPRREAFFCFIIPYSFVMAHGLKHILLLAAVFATTASASAQTEVKAEPDSVVNIVNALNSTENIRVTQDPELTKLLERREGVEKRADQSDNDASGQGAVRRSRSGYRVEVFADNNVRTAKIQAASKKRKIESRFPQYRVYLVFESPFWRVRLGDFPSRSGAEGALGEVRSAFPALRNSLRVVRSSINPN